jgi:ubiquinone/menaquinone biosynthesis C-methylase UbiE
MSSDITKTIGGKTITFSFSGSIPENYDEYLGPLIFEPYALDIAGRISALQPATILELACGTGRVTKYLRSASSAGATLTATDLNPAMLEVAKRHASADNVSWGVVDAGALPYEADSYDAIVCQFGIMFVPDRVQAYAEARRVLKPGGTLLISSWDAIEYNPIFHIAQKRIVRFFHEHIPTFYRIPYSYHNEQVMHDELTQAGFTDFTIERVTLEGTSPSAEAAAKGLLEGNPVVGEIAAQGPDAMPMIFDDLVADIKEEFGSGELKVPLQAWVMTAKK